MLAKVLHNGRGSIGSSIAVGHLLRPLCLYKRVVNFKLCLQKAIFYGGPLHTADKENWSSSAFFKAKYDAKKSPCKNCQMRFDSLDGFISKPLSDPLAENRNGTFLGACAEYCPVNLLLADDVESQRDKQLISTLEKYRNQCSVLFRSLGIIVNDCCKAYESRDSRFTKKVYKQIRPKVHIFGLKPECNNQFRLTSK